MCQNCCKRTIFSSSSYRRRHGHTTFIGTQCSYSIKPIGSHYIKQFHCDDHWLRLRVISAAANHSNVGENVSFTINETKEVTLDRTGCHESLASSIVSEDAHTLYH